MRGKKKEGTSKAIKNNNSAAKIGEELQTAVEARRDSPSANNPNDQSYQSSGFTETESTAEGPLDGKQGIFYTDETEGRLQSYEEEALAFKKIQPKAAGSQPTSPKETHVVEVPVTNVRLNTDEDDHQQEE